MPTHPATPKIESPGPKPLISGRSNPISFESALCRYHRGPRLATFVPPGTTFEHESTRRYHRDLAAPDDGAVREPRYGRRGPLAGAAAPAGAPERSAGAPGRPSWPGCPSADHDA